MNEIMVKSKCYQPKFLGLVNAYSRFYKPVVKWMQLLPNEGEKIKNGYQKMRGETNKRLISDLRELLKE